MNVAVAEQAVERYYAAVSQQQITDAQATLTTDDDPSGAPDPIQFYRGSTDYQRQQLDHALVHRLYLADSRITDHEPRPKTPLT